MLRYLLLLVLTLSCDLLLFTIFDFNRFLESMPVQCLPNDAVISGIFYIIPGNNDLTN